MNIQNINWEDRNEVLNAIKENPEHVILGVGVEANLDVIDRIKSDKEFMLEAVKQEGHLLSRVSTDLKNDKDIVLAAVNQYGFSLVHAGVDLRNDKDVALAAVKHNGYLLEYAGKDMRRDSEVILAAARQDMGSLMYASEELQKDKNFIEEIEKIRQERTLRQHTPEEISEGIFPKKIEIEKVEQEIFK